MLELEHEYLRRHPKRTWQGSDTESGTESIDLSEQNTLAQIKLLFKSFVDQMNVLLADDSTADPDAEPDDHERAACSPSSPRPEPWANWKRTSTHESWG
jgi:hypothetical protein